MLPVTRANLDSICCTCLVNICQSKDVKQKAYDVKKETNLLNMLKVTAYIDVLKNPLNLKSVNEYCSKVCDICFLNVENAFKFREKLIASNKKLAHLLEIKSSIKELKGCCRICLNCEKCEGNEDDMYDTYIKLIKDFSGMNEHTNELLLKHDGLLPKQLCQSCLEELQNIEELQVLSKYSFEHIVAELSKNDNVLPIQQDLPENGAIEKEFSTLQKNLKSEDKSKPPSDQNEKLVLKCEKEDSQYQQILYDNANMALKYSQQEENNINVTIALNAYPEESTIIPKINKNHNIFQTKPSPSKDETTTENELLLPQNNAKNDDEIQPKKVIILESEEDDIVLDTLPSTSKGKRNKKEVFRPRKSSQHNEKGVTMYNSNEKILLKCEEEDTEFQEIIYDKPNPQENIDLMDSQNEENKTAASIVLVNEADHSDESTMDFERDDDDDFALTDNVELTTSDSNATNEESKNYKQNQIVSAEQKLLEKYYQSKGEPKTKKLYNTCPICFKDLARTTSLRRHISTMHENNKPFQCSHCPKAFTCTYFRNLHELTHTGEFPLECELCPRRFRRRSQLKKHLEKHIGKPKLLCSICKRGYKTKGQLKEHIKVHEKESFPCPWCDRVYSKRYNFEIHQLAVHLKVQPYKCKFCDELFNKQIDRIKHEKSHFEDKS